MGKLAGGECGCTRNSFPTGMPRVQVVAFGCTSFDGCLIECISTICEPNWMILGGLEGAF